MTKSAEAFNRAQLDTPGPTAGPFNVTVDQAAKQIIMSRTPEWWGTQPRLDRLVLVTVAPADQVLALENNEVDVTNLAAAIDIATARRMRGVEVRQAPAMRTRSVHFNQCDACMLADKSLRRAIAQGIDRDAIARITQRGITDHPIAAGSHVYQVGHSGYKDNSDVLPYDPDAARSQLDALGWKFNGRTREKDGRSLSFDDVYVNDPAEDLLAQLLADMMDAIGVELTLHPIEADQRINYRGGFGVTHYETTQDNPFPLSGLAALFGSDGRQNAVGTAPPGLDAKIAEAVRATDDRSAQELANAVDVMLWDSAQSVPLVRTFDTIAVRSDVANYGAFGGADVDATAIGYLPQ
jgi:peptide/nickel transport system substrate-binding protein